MARKYKSRVSADKLDVKIEQQKEVLEKALRRVSVINLAELPEFQERYLKHIDFPG